MFRIWITQTDGDERTLRAQAKPPTDLVLALGSNCGFAVSMRCAPRSPKTVARTLQSLRGVTGVTLFVAECLPQLFVERVWKPLVSAVACSLRCVTLRFCRRGNPYLSLGPRNNLYF